MSSPLSEGKKKTEKKTQPTDRKDVKDTKTSEKWEREDGGTSKCGTRLKTEKEGNQQSGLNQGGEKTTQEEKKVEVEVHQDQEMVKDHHWYFLHGEEELAPRGANDCHTGTLLAEMTGEDTFDFEVDTTED